MTSARVFVAVLALAACTRDVTVFDDAPARPAPDPPTTRTLAAGAHHTCALFGGVTYCWGANSHDALGTLPADHSALPVRIDTTFAFVSLGVGQDFACGVDGGGALACWGANVHGQLGQGDTADRPAPTLVPLPAPVARLSVGSNHVCVIDATKALSCWGYNRENGIGVGGDPGRGEDVPSRMRVAGDDWRFVAAGDGHTCAGHDDGSLYCWGRDSMSECGQGEGAPAQITTPARVGSRSDWIAVDAGQFGTCAIDRSLAVWCWGDNEFSTQAGAPPRVDSPARIPLDVGAIEARIRAFDTCARSVGGALTCWGKNEFAEIGFIDRAPRTSPTPAFEGSRFTEIALGLQHTCARKLDGSVWCAGRNFEGEVGDGTTSEASGWSAVRAP